MASGSPSDSSSATMSLVPYVPEQSREIVLRHNSTVVVYDQRSRQLSLRDVSQSDSVEPALCPTCHRPYTEDASSRGRSERLPPEQQERQWADPAYFGMLQHSTAPSRDRSNPSSPTRRLHQPARGEDDVFINPPDGTEFVASEPRSPSRASGISSSAFTQGYFKTFFEEERELGRGGKGVVLLVRHVLDGVPLGQFAVKRVPVGDDHAWLEKVLLEVQLLQNLTHPNLVAYKHVWLEDCQITQFGPSVPCAFILQQYCNGGDLHNYVLGHGNNNISTEKIKEQIRRRAKGSTEASEERSPHRRMGFEEVFSFFKDITSGLHHLHSHGYIHRDLKPHNCLLHGDGNGRFRVLVSDFGEVQMQDADRKSTGATGTISYCAPEVLLRDAASGTFGNFTVKSDIFSSGMIVYFMCFGKLPYSSADDINDEKEDVDELRAEISTWAGFDDERRIRVDLPDKLYRFLKRLLSLDPNDRPNTDEILFAIKTGAMEDPERERSGYLNDLRHRISNLDTPSPTPRRRSRDNSHGLRTQASASASFNAPAPSRLRMNVSATQGPDRHKAHRIDGIVEDHDQQPSQAPMGNSTESMFGPVKTQLALPPPPAPERGGLTQIVFARPESVLTLKVAIFLLKIHTLRRACSPFEGNWRTTYPLLVLAVFDLISTQTIEPGASLSAHGLQSLTLMLVHMIIIGSALRYRVLCSQVAWHGE